jgi:hypothetical protein
MEFASIPQIRHHLLGLFDPVDLFLGSPQLRLELCLLLQGPPCPDFFVSVLLLLQESLRPQPVLVQPSGSILVRDTFAVPKILPFDQSLLKVAL